MGITLLLINFSEIILPSGVHIVKDQTKPNNQIAIGLEINPDVIVMEKASGLFNKKGYNYLYLRDADSLNQIKKFIRLLLKDSLFKKEDLKLYNNLLRIALLKFKGNISPIVNITVGITGNVDENYIADLFSIIPDSAISNLTDYYTLKPIQGNHIYIGEENFIANISPSPGDIEFISFLLCLQILKNRGFDIDYSLETAPSPFLIYVKKENIESLFIKPEKEEIKKGLSQIKNWIKKEVNESNYSKMLIRITMMGVREDIFFDWMKKLEYITQKQIILVWKRFLIDGFISSGTSEFVDAILNVFPEAEVIE
jgi:hypothetical protein